MEKPTVVGINGVACVTCPPTAIAALGAGEAAVLLAAACWVPAWVAEGGLSFML